MTRPSARKRENTRTSAFGSAGRRSHDASMFYSSRLYQIERKHSQAEYIETPLHSDNINQIFHQSSRSMDQLADNSVHLMVTSPPYNVGKEYDQDLTLEEYRSFLRDVWMEVYRILTPGGRACVNIANLGRKPYLPVHAYIIQDMLASGFRMRGEIIWNKAASAAGSTAWGSWMSATNPILRDVHEYILVFSKGEFGRPNPGKRPSTISREEFLEYTKSVWSFPAESAKKIGHPAPFPIDLPYRLIQLYSFADEVILDPFIGSGQTAIAAIRAGRNFVGYETEADYIKLAWKRITQEQDRTSH